MGLSLADINCSPMDFTAVITANSVVALSFGKNDPPLSRISHSAQACIFLKLSLLWFMSSK